MVGCTVRKGSGLLPVMAVAVAAWIAAVCAANAAEAKIKIGLAKAGAFKHPSGVVEPLPIGIAHDSLSAADRAPLGPVSFNQGTVHLRFRSSVTVMRQVRVRVWAQSAQSETWSKLSAERPGVWGLDLPLPSHVDILDYFFEATAKDGAVFYFGPSDPKLESAGPGTWSATRDDTKSFRLSVYDPQYTVPEWMEGALIYQIFPDRFRDGDLSNDPLTGSGWIYGAPVAFRTWDQPVCDPLRPPCLGMASTQFYGGDLQGVIDQLDYLQSLGVTALYFNPIFQAASNHRYDTQNYLLIDPRLGDLSVFETLIAEADRRGMRVILDGVFNHTSSDSPYFDFYHRWSTSGACESDVSPYRAWYLLPDAGSPGQDTHHLIQHCQPGNLSYEAWSGHGSMPKLNAKSAAMRNYFYRGGGGAVGPYWAHEGVSGWRLDVGDAVDGGPLRDPANGFWSNFRNTIRAVEPDSVLIGEFWGNATPWLLGQDWDSVMNYRLRSLLLAWMFDRCQGSGCDLGGARFMDGDSNPASVLGAIEPASESHFVRRLASLQEDTPPPAWGAMMNLLDSHDTSRILFLLKKCSLESATDAVQKLKFLAMFLYSYPGAPTIYYGDEAGLQPDDVWDGQSWKDDPYNRAPYPWPDRGLSRDEGLLQYFQALGQTRKTLPVLAHGSFSVVAVDDVRRLLVFKRTLPGSEVWSVLHRGALAETVRLDVTATLPNSTWLRDAQSGQRWQVMNGFLDLGTMQGLSGRWLVRE